VVGMIEGVVAAEPPDNDNQETSLEKRLKPIEFEG
jgi:hypothetical protein